MINKFEQLKINFAHENDLAMPNTLFKQLLELKKDKSIKANHAPFIYSYLYLQTYMYRYSKYNNYVPSISDIKRMLGYTNTNKTIDYIIKRDGLLDNLGLTVSVNDYPISTVWKDEDGIPLDRPQFETITQLSKSLMIDEEDTYSNMWKKENGINKNSYCKLPVFAFYNNKEDYFLEENIQYAECDGTFYKSDNTTIIPFSVFKFCMEHEELGCTGFYLYAYLKHKNDLHSEGYDASHKRLSEELGLSEKTIQTYRNALRSYNMITLKHNMTSFSPNMKAEDRKVSTNIVHVPIEFSLEKIEYTKFKDSSVKDECSNQKIIEFDLDSLPY